MVCARVYVEADEKRDIIGEQERANLIVQRARIFCYWRAKRANLIVLCARFFSIIGERSEQT